MKNHLVEFLRGQPTNERVRDRDTWTLESQHGRPGQLVTDRELSSAPVRFGLEPQWKLRLDV
jgi:hypothetical protein